MRRSPEQPPEPTTEDLDVGVGPVDEDGVDQLDHGAHVAPDEDRLALPKDRPVAVARGLDLPPRGEDRRPPDAHESPQNPS